jgi:haloacetate dehalogenase
MRFALGYWHWFFLAQPAPLPERMIGADPEAFYFRDGRGSGHFHPEALAEYRRAIRDPATVHAMCEDYRAGLGIDRRHDEDDRSAGRRVTCPMLFLWSARDDLAELYGDPVAIWQAWATDLRAGSIDSGHHVAEEAPDELAAHLGELLDRAA